ncbi:methyltransferase domain-containing protein [Dyella tabacisoli]|uniref:Class I SAM-dependent methyltransferase n=1 Tax=Dyella tabacisoli TaxID=2282381 RepID=A0A369ULJ3_9GAMM|nr:class I SAM-dependent methyltransferase [Dyella tabacisoli]RDD80588.1 class I SAM-dependent methyltransferase [Dyella tabacisoli]
MHVSSYQHMQDLVARYLDTQRSLSVVDIGSYDVNGSYRTLFGNAKWSYQGIDLEAGPGVDIVLSSPYRLPFASGSVDLVVSGQAFEHVEYFWMSWLEMVRVLKPGGMIFLIAPSRGPEHRYPQDCWRFYPDGYRALAKFGSCELVEVTTDWEPHPDPGSRDWGDTVGVFRKSRVGLRARAFQAAMRIAGRLHTSA